MSDIATVERRHRVLLVHLSGSLDLSNRDDLQAAVARAEGVSGDADAVVVDLARVTFMDCAALGVLTVLADHCRAQRRRFLVAEARPIARRLLTALNLDRTFVLADTAEDGVVLAETWIDLHDVRPYPTEDR